MISKESENVVWSDIEPLDITKILNVNFPKNKFYTDESEKKQIILHHSASGPGVRGDIESYVNNPYKNATHIIIDRKGDIYQLFHSKYWSHHLNIPAKDINLLGFEDYATRNKKLNMESISIELDSWGELEKLTPTRYRNNKSKVFTFNENEVSYYENGFKGHKYYEGYTHEQLKSLGELLVYWSDMYDIPLDYKGDSMFDVNINAIGGEPGIWTQSSYRKDVNNCHPDKNLISLLKHLDKK